MRNRERRSGAALPWPALALDALAAMALHEMAQMAWQAMQAARARLARHVVVLLSTAGFSASSARTSLCDAMAREEALWARMAAVR